MDVLYFLKDRTRFIRKFYDVTESMFADTKQKIKDGEPPFDDPPYAESDEPPFMDEYSDADDSQEFLGQACVSFLSATLKLFFDTERAEISRYRRRSPELDKTDAKKGLFLANQKWFADSGIDFAKSGADLEIIEEVVLTRNVAQHPEWIGTMTLTLRGKEVKKRPVPWFAHELERRSMEGKDVAELERFSWMLRISRERFLQAVDEVEKLCEYIDRRAFGKENGRNAGD